MKATYSSGELVNKGIDWTWESSRKLPSLTDCAYGMSSKLRIGGPRLINNAWWHVLGDLRLRQRRALTRAEYQTPAGITIRQKISQTRKAFSQTPDGKEKVKAVAATRAANREQLLIKGLFTKRRRSEEISEDKIPFYSTPAGIRVRRERSEKLKAFYKTPAGKEALGRTAEHREEGKAFREFMKEVVNLNDELVGLKCYLPSCHFVTTSENPRLCQAGVRQHFKKAHPGIKPKLTKLIPIFKDLQSTETSHATTRSELAGVQTKTDSDFERAKLMRTRAGYECLYPGCGKRFIQACNAAKHMGSTVLHDGSLKWEMADVRKNYKPAAHGAAT